MQYKSKPEKTRGTGVYINRIIESNIESAEESVSRVLEGFPEYNLKADVDYGNSQIIIAGVEKLPDSVFTSIKRRIAALVNHAGMHLDSEYEGQLDLIINVLSNKSESKKRRGTGVCLNQIKEASSPELSLIPEISKLVRLAATKYRDPKISEVAETAWDYDLERNIVAFDISGLTEKQIWRIEDTIKFNDYSSWGDYLVEVYPDKNLMTVMFR